MDTANTTTGTSIIDKDKNGAKKLVELAETIAGFVMPGYSTPKDILSHILNYIKPADFNLIVGKGREANLLEKTVIIINQLVEVAAKHNRSIRIDKGRIYIYNGRYWRRMDDAEQFLGRVAKAMGLDLFQAQYHTVIKKLFKQLQCAAYTHPIERDKSKVLINVLNGTLHITAEEAILKKHNPDDNLKHCIEVEYQENAMCPKFTAFSNQMIPDSERLRLFFEFIAYCFMPGLKLEKMLLLVGDGSNGKSVLYEIIHILFGADNVSSFSLQELTTGYSMYYNREKMYGKILNYGSDISNVGFNNSEYKKIISRESIVCRQIRERPFETDDIPPMIFNSNELPAPSSGQEKSILRRLEIMEMNVTVSDSEININLAEEICSDQQEREGILRMIVEHAVTVIAQQGLSLCKASRRIIDEIMEESDTVSNFLEDKGYTPEGSTIITRAEMINQYRSYCYENSYDGSMGPTVLTRKIKTKGFKYEKGKSGASAREFYVKLKNNN